MTRITPRTCLWPLTGALVLTFALSIGLTFRSNHHCYAGVCGEWLFPLQARLHVVVWYSWLSISVAFLAVRAFHPQMRRVLGLPVIKGKLPFVGKQFSVSGALVVLWVCSLYGIVTGIWWKRLERYFDDRGKSGDITKGNDLLAAIALTGHYADVTMGMILLPVSRHSALASFFKLSAATCLAFHMLLAYTLFSMVLIHGLLYLAWVPIFNHLSTIQRRVFPVLNPTYLYHEVFPGTGSSIGNWRASLIFSGISCAAILILLGVTTLPWIRSRHFNVFYFTHLSSILAVVIICLHASTMFYCMAPGLAMWLLDWMMRFYELREELTGKVSDLSRGWYLLSLNIPRSRLDGCSCKSPLAHFYIYHGDSSSRELHPFTTVTHLASEAARQSGTETLPIEFLFRKRGNISEDTASAPAVKQKHKRASAFTHLFRCSKRRSRAHLQWTDRLASLAHSSNVLKSEPKDHDTGVSAGVLELDNRLGSANTALRLEGPYFTPSDPAKYNIAVCLVAGTGISGALAIADAFRAAKEAFSSEATTTITPSSRPLWSRCVIVWSVRADDFVDLSRHFTSLQPSTGLQFRTHLTGAGRPRLDMAQMLNDVAFGSRPDESAATAGMGEDRVIPWESDNKQTGQKKNSVWAYISGPPAFIAAGETASKIAGVDYYGARWDI